MQSKWIRWRRAARALCRTPVLADAGDCEGQSVELHSLRMLEMPTNSPFALSTSTPCGCWRWRRTSSPCVCRTPILADAGDGDEQSVRFTEPQSLRMLEMAKGRPCTSSPCGCWRCRPTAHALWRTPILADAGDIQGQSVRNSTACGCSRWRRTIRALCRTPILADVGDGEGQSVKLQSLRMLEMATKSPFALSNSNPCGCWKRRRTVRVTPVLVDAGDGGGQFIRPAELHSLRLWR